MKKSREKISTDTECRKEKSSEEGMTRMMR
jgi:hypothetical protein